MTLTEYVLKILPQPQVAAAMVRAVAVAVGGGITTFVTLWTFDVETVTALKAVAAGMLGTISVRGVAEGSFDWMRARSGNVKPWDVAAYEEPLQR